jgi:hypothetical protein
MMPFSQFHRCLQVLAASVSKKVVFETTLLPLPANNIANHALYILGRVFGIPLLLSFPGFLCFGSAAVVRG